MTRRGGQKTLRRKGVYGGYIKRLLRTGKGNVRMEILGFLLGVFFFVLLEAFLQGLK